MGSAMHFTRDQILHKAVPKPSFVPWDSSGQAVCKELTQHPFSRVPVAIAALPW